MKALPITLIIALFFNALAFSQYKPGQVLVTINKKPITAGEFERVYLKNSQVGTAEKESVESYFDLFVKFKLKVTAAIDSGLDTLPSFKNELKGYREQLAKTYLIDNATLDRLVKEAYDRTAYEVQASHIMVTLQPNASPADTLVAWNKIMAAKNRLDKGEAFDKVAEELSEDPSAKTNKGMLGYFNAFRIPSYAFENAAYNTPVGSISQPFKTRFGYHIMKVNNKRKSAGEVKVAHIMAACPESAADDKKAEAQKKANDIYQRIQQGEIFDTLAVKLSDDQYSARNNGELSWFGAGMMVPEFEEAAFALKNKGDITKPVKTAYGWHIIKLIDTKPIAEFEKLQNDLKTKVIQDERNSEVQKSFAAKLIAEYKPVINKKSIEGLNKLDSMFFKAETNLKLKCDTLATFITIGKTKYPLGLFIEYIQPLRANYSKWAVKDFTNLMVKNYTDKIIVEYESNNLEKKYPDFANLAEEYYEGILLFDIMERKVWSKASADSIGLEAYFEKFKSKYSDPEPKPLEDIRGIVMSDYQTYLEENWIAELRNKYPVITDEKLLNKIAQKHNTAKK